MQEPSKIKKTIKKTKRSNDKSTRLAHKDNQQTVQNHYFIYSKGSYTSVDSHTAG